MTEIKYERSITYFLSYNCATYVDVFLKALISIIFYTMYFLDVGEMRDGRSVALVIYSFFITLRISVYITYFRKLSVLADFRQ